ncbi:MAG TPA: amidohydrolase family protein [Gemmatimonadaceae bacterium]|nr:amidohydrolase family protein [Gemmatimonadaceae bacterium]
MRTSIVLSSMLVVLTAVGAHAQSVAIVGGKVFPVSGPPIEHATVLIKDGKIAAVGTNVAIPADAKRVDATGKWVTPGLVNAATQVTIMEVGSVAGTREGSPRGSNGIAAAYRVWDGVNPNSVLIQPARNGGVTSVVIGPSGGLVSGQAAVVQLVDGDAAAMTLRAPVAMVAQVGNARAAGVNARGELLNRLRELIEDTKFYMAHRLDYDRAQSRQLSASKMDLEAMIPVVQGKLPLVIETNKASDIVSALDLAKQYGLKIMIGGGAEAWEVADRLAAAKVPVITGAMNNIPMSFAELGAEQENAGKLARAGVSVALIGNAGGGDEEAFNVRNVRFEAGNAVAYGMKWDDALRAITLTPAEMFGVAARVGSLQPGKDGDVVVWSGDPFEFATQPEQVFIRGKEVDAPSRQDMLEQRYKKLPPDYEKKP